MDNQTGGDDPRERHIARSRKLEKELSDQVFELRGSLEPGQRAGRQRQLFEALYPILKGYLANKRLPPSDLEDVLQEALLKVFTHLDQWAGRGSFLAYCYRITTNEFYLWWRKKRPINQHETPLVEPGEDNAFAAEPTTSAPTPIEHVIEGQMQRRLRRIVSQLPPRRRVCIELFCFQELPYREIARRLNISVGTVSANINFAKHQLKKDRSLDDLCPWEPREGSDLGPVPTD